MEGKENGVTGANQKAQSCFLFFVCFDKIVLLCLHIHSNLVILLTLDSHGRTYRTRYGVKL